MYSLASFHTFGLCASAKSFINVKSAEQLADELSALGKQPFLILGEGSNSIFLEDYLGCIIRPTIKGIDVQQKDSHVVLKVGAGENWHHLVSWCLSNQIYGFENLALIPGTVGAAPIQNIGAYGVEVERFIKSVDYYDLAEQSPKSLKANECQFGYRESIFKSELAGRVVITEVTFSLPKDWQPVQHYGELSLLTNPRAQDVFNKVIALRQSKLPDPKHIGNAGSFFKNPIIGQAHYAALIKDNPSMPCYPVDEHTVKVPAAWLIDQLGFKGQKEGGIGCHPQQALVLTNDGTGTGEQLLTLARRIKSSVQNAFSIELEHEVRLIGKHGPVNL